MSEQRYAVDTPLYIPVATDTSGKSIDALDGLKRFLVQTKEHIKKDEIHFIEECLSDVFAFYEAYETVHHTMEDGSLDHFAENYFAFISAGAALYLLNNINAQRSAKRDEFKKSLVLLHNYKRDKANEALGSTPEERREKALENLEQKMRRSGLQFANLPHNTERFNKGEFKELAEKYGVGKSISQRVMRQCHDFARSPLSEGMKISSNALSYISYKGQTAYDALRHPKQPEPQGTDTQVTAERKSFTKQSFKSASDATKQGISKGLDYHEKFWSFLGEIASQGVSNIGKLSKTTPNKTAEGFRETRALHRDIKSHKAGKAAEAFERRRQALQEEKAEDQKLNHISHVTFECIAQFSYHLSEEDKRVITEKVKDKFHHQSNAKRARTSFLVQFGFMAAQAGQAGAKISGGDVSTLWMNAYSIILASGPLRGFADELIRERGKANSKDAEAAEFIAKKAGLTTEPQ